MTKANAGGESPGPGVCQAKDDRSWWSQEQEKTWTKKEDWSSHSKEEDEKWTKNSSWNWSEGWSEKSDKGHPAGKGLF